MAEVLQEREPAHNALEQVVGVPKEGHSKLEQIRAILSKKSKVEGADLEICRVI